MSYSLFDYGCMINDEIRMDAYVKALHKVIKPDCTVADIGTGTGIFAMIACQLGARRVYAIEPNDGIWLAIESAKANGLNERIEFIQNLSTEIQLPEPVDVIISDMRGVLPLYQHHIPAIIDARRRFLGPEGILIPQSDSLHTAIVEIPDIYKNYARPWTKNPYGLNLYSGHRNVTNSWQKVRLKAEELLTKPQVWATLDYITIEEPDIIGQVIMTVDRSGTGHGLIIWFDAQLVEGIGFSNEPGKPEVIYGSLFLPWSEPVPLAVGDTVTVEIRANLVGDDYIWSWNTLVLAQEQSDQVKARFKQSTFYSLGLSPTNLHKQSSDHRQKLNKEGRIVWFALNLMDNNQPLQDIADQLVQSFPKRFPDIKRALTYLGELSIKYGE